KRISHFWLENCAVRYIPTSRRHVRFGSKADILHRLGDVRFTPKSGHSLSVSGCPLCAKSGHGAEHKNRCKLGPGIKASGPSFFLRRAVTRARKAWLSGGRCRGTGTPPSLTSGRHLT